MCCCSTVVTPGSCTWLWFPNKHSSIYLPLKPQTVILTFQFVCSLGLLGPLKGLYVTIHQESTFMNQFFFFFLLAVFYLPIEECGSCVSSLKVLDCGILCKGLRSDFLQQSKGCDVMLVPIDLTWALGFGHPHYIQILYFLPAQWETASNSSLYLER